MWSRPRPWYCPNKILSLPGTPRPPSRRCRPSLTALAQSSASWSPQLFLCTQTRSSFFYSCRRPSHVHAFYRGEQNAVKNVYLTRSIQVDRKVYRQNDTCTINGQEYLIVAIKLHYYHNNATGRKVSIVLANLTTSEFGQVMALSTLHTASHGQQRLKKRSV